MLRPWLRLLKDGHGRTDTALQDWMSVKHPDTDRRSPGPHYPRWKRKPDFVFLGSQEPKEYILRRDGKVILRAAQSACVAYLHRAHSYSASHALNYEGYTLTPVF